MGDLARIVVGGTALLSGMLFAVNLLDTLYKSVAPHYYIVNTIHFNGFCTVGLVLWYRQIIGIFIISLLF